MLPNLIPGDNVVRKCDAQQQLDKSRQDNIDDKSHHKPSMTSQGADKLSEAATKIRQNLSNRSLPASASYMATKEDEAMQPVINDVRTLQVPEQRKTQQEINTSVRSPPCESSKQITKSTSQPVYNGRTEKNTQVIPQRPQDLLENIPLDLVRVNVKSSAQYRKSYAFKIWRDKGSFPYRVAEQPIVKEVTERKKSKKHLNAIRAQKDRENEEAWKAFKSCRSTNNEMKYRRSSKLQPRPDETFVKHCEKEQLNTILSVGQENDSKARNTKHQNSIPDYFKNKKDSTSKSVPPISPTKSIPTSVIHVNTTKASHVSTQTIQAEQRTLTSQTVYSDDILEATKGTGIRLTSNPTSKEALLADNRDEYCSTSQWSGEQTSSVGMYNTEHVQGQRELNAKAAVSGSQQISVQTMTCDRSAEISSGLEETCTIECLQEENRSTKQYNSQSLTMNLISDNPSPVVEKDTEQLTRKCNSKSDESFYPPSPLAEPSVNSQIDNSNLALIIKNSLAKKYSKENVRPTVGSATGDRHRKRSRNDSVNNEAGEHQRLGSKQQKVTMFTRLDETVAKNLADGIHNVNSEYFPIEALANKAAKETSKSVSDAPERNTETAKIQHKLNEIERARLLLKELFDVTSESGGDNEMKTFDVESRSFGRKNILNHLSLIDRYFAEFQKKLSSTDG